jgi:hypothetical protein
VNRDQHKLATDRTLRALVKRPVEREPPYEAAMVDA